MSEADAGFLVGGGAQPSGGGALTYDFANFGKNCMKLRKFWAWDGGGDGVGGG